MTFNLEVEEEACTGCGNCVISCPINALKVEEACGGKGGGVELNIENGITCVISDACNGCGVCVVACSQRALSLKTLEPSFTDRELRISELSSQTDGENGEIMEADEEPLMRFKIDQKKKALLESILTSLKTIKVRHLIETGKGKAAREKMLKSKDAKRDK
ncbi:MAG: 4Fe-4S binding protein [Candidatus Hydrothermarchaeota archaeon]|nr:4Fe-4S binding protein [Candidatus Hydrothermarchaeota archaeon]